MATNPDAPLSGVFRVVYFLAIGVTCLFVVVTAITAFYDPPEGDSGFPDNDNPFFQDEAQFEADNDREDYNRNVSLIFAVTAAAAYAVAIFGLGARFNPLRAGLLLGGLLLFLTAMGFWTDSTNEWLGFLSASVILVLLLGGYSSLEDGFPIRRAPPSRRLTPEEVTMSVPVEPPADDGSPPPVA